MDKTNRIVLFGGSFDPVQTAHVGIVKNLTKRFERTVVIPGFVSPFKREGTAAAAEVRLAMLKASLQKVEKITVSDFEILKGGISYTIDTVMHFQKEYKGKDLYFAIGSDLLKTLHKWYRFDELKNLVTFYVIGRDGFIPKPAVLKKLQKLGANIELADFDGGEASGSRAKLEIAFDKYGSIPAAAARIIQKENLYADYRFITDAYPVFHLSDERIRHSVATAVSAIHLAKLYNAPVADAVTAALLHDIAKDADEKLLQELGIVLPDEAADAPKKVCHAFYGAAVAKQYFGIKKKSILDAIYYHTTGKPRMSKLGKIIFLSDLIESGREDFNGLIQLREACAVSLNAAMKLALILSVEKLKNEGKAVYYLTTDAYEFYTQSQMKKAAAPFPAQSPRTAINPPASANFSEDHLARTIARLLDDKKARDITLINLNGKTIVADYFVIATVGSTTAVRALTDFVDEELSKKHGIEPLRRDLDPKWAAIDYGSVILHIQVDEIRKFYDLERLWSDGNNVEKLRST